MSVFLHIGFDIILRERGVYMWTNETIFSLGDLSRTDEYSEFIDSEYDGDRSVRLEHVNHMIERLQAEKEMLEE